MTIMQKLVTRFASRISATGLTVYILSSHNKHPRQNAMLQTMVIELTNAGVNVLFRQQNQAISGRGILILWDDKANLESRNQWDKIINSNNLRWILSFGSDFEQDDFGVEWELVAEFTEEDRDGSEHIQVWKRTRVKI